MARLAGVPIVEAVLRRVRAASEVDEVVLAIPEGADDDVLERVGSDLGIRVHRGPEEDVLTRFLGALEAVDAEVCVRVCADNPLVAPEEVDRIVSHHLDSRPDYSFNHVPGMGNGYPDGLGAEVVEMKVLLRLGQIVTDPRQREHVTRYIWEHPREFRVETVEAPDTLRGKPVRLDVDVRNDLEILAELLSPEAELPPEEWDAVGAVRRKRSGRSPDRGSDES